jgi:hypothetical protein
MKLRVATLLLALSPLLGGARSFASETPAPEQFTQWIADLSDESFQKRSEAETALRANPVQALESYRKAKLKNGELAPDDPNAALYEELWAAAELESLLKPKRVALEYTSAKPQTAAPEMLKSFGWALEEGSARADANRSFTFKSDSASWAEAFEAFYRGAGLYPYVLSSQPGMMSLANEEAWGVTHHQNFLFMAKCIQKFYFTEKGRRKPEDFWSLEFDAHAPSPFFQKYIVQLQSLEVIAAGGTKMRAHGERGPNDCASRAMFNSGMVIDADQIPVIGDKPFDLECKFIVMWPKHLKSVHYAFPPKAGEQELTKSIGRTVSFAVKPTEQGQGTVLTWQQEVKSGASPEMRIALGWLNALDEKKQLMPFKNQGGTTRGSDEGEFRESIWSFPTPPQELRYIYADEFMPVECTVVFKGMKVAENSGM